MEIKQCAFGHFYDASINRQCPYCCGRNNASPDPGIILRETLAPSGREPADGAAQDAQGEAVRPVVGWLVCVEGPDKGRSYEVHNENNFVGRSSTMDINIQGDPGISRDKPVIITYDSRSRAFFCGFMNGRGVVRLNDRPLLSTTELKSGDRIEISKTKLMFMPLCGEQFDWDWDNLNG